jgi:hypothetical protein
VHLLVLPRVNPSQFLQTLKGFTAREANKLLGRTGQPFWQAESYDHWVRDPAEAERIRAYIESNPVKAGLVARAEDYPWSSAHGRVEMILCQYRDMVNVLYRAHGIHFCAVGRCRKEPAGRV